MDGINLRNVPNRKDNPRSFFDLSFKRAFDYKFGDVIPVMMLPVMPDDEINASYEFLQRFAPFVSQVYQDYKVVFDFYFVPNRLIWRNFELFMSGGYDGNREYLHPYFGSYAMAHRFNTASNFDTRHTIFDYLDIPHGVFALDEGYSEDINALPLAAYLQCYLDYKLGVGTPLNSVYEYVMSNEQIVHDGDNTNDLSLLYAKIARRDPLFVWPTQPDIAVLMSPLKCLYPLDYFTSARPDPQLGPVMTIPLQLVSTDKDGVDTFRLTSNANSTQTTDPTGANKMYVRTVAGSKQLRIYINNPASNGITINGEVLQNVATINDFYSAARIQELLTLYNFTGFTPQDRIAAEFGVKNKDARMHRAEWLHSSIHDISIGEVFSNNANNSTGDSGVDIPGVGTAIATASTADRGFSHYFTEYGFVVGLMSLYPEASYCQGLPRIYSVKDRFDYPHFLLSEIGMSAIRQKEVMLSQAIESNKDNEFAYMSQYGDWKVGINRVNGSLRGNLNYMSAGRMFDSDYVVPFNDEFLQVDPSFNNLDRTFNILTYNPHHCPLYSKISFNIHAKRQLPYYGLPKF